MKERLERILESWIAVGIISAYEIEQCENGTLLCHVKSMPERGLRGRLWNQKQGWIADEKPFNNICLGSWTIVPDSIVLAIGFKRPKGK